MKTEEAIATHYPAATVLVGRWSAEPARLERPPADDARSPGPPIRCRVATDRVRRFSSVAHGWTLSDIRRKVPKVHRSGFVRAMLSSGRRRERERPRRWLVNTGTWPAGPPRGDLRAWVGVG
jgi:hypothetical protein